MEVILLGTGGPRPDPRRMATTTLIRLGEENILFDAGRGVMVQLSKAGVPLGAINTVFPTIISITSATLRCDAEFVDAWGKGRSADLWASGHRTARQHACDPGLRQGHRLAVIRESRPLTAGSPWPRPTSFPARSSTQAGGRSAPSSFRMAKGSTCQRHFSRAGCASAIVSKRKAVIAISGDTVPCPVLARAGLVPGNARDQQRAFPQAGEIRNRLR